MFILANYLGMSMNSMISFPSYLLSVPGCLFLCIVLKYEKKEGYEYV